jgi:hypothetical protein
MKIQATRCLLCGDLIFSRTRHDMRWCSCENVSVDGGFDYNKGSLNGPLESIRSETIELDVDKHTLYDDWNSREDKFGLMKWSGTQEELEALRAKALLMS